MSEVKAQKLVLHRMQPALSYVTKHPSTSLEETARTLGHIQAIEELKTRLGFTLPLPPFPFPKALPVAKLPKGSSHFPALPASSLGTLCWQSPIPRNSNACGGPALANNDA